MKISDIFVPEKDLTNKINNYLEEKPSSLYDHVKKVYKGLESKNICLLYGPPGTGKTFANNKTKEALAGEYNISYIYLPPVDSLLTVTKEEFFQSVEDNIVAALSSNKKAYVEIRHIEKFSKPAQEALDCILMEYKNNKNVVFVIESYHKHTWFSSMLSFQEEPAFNIKFTKKKL